MAHVNIITSQLLQLIPRHVFEHIVGTHAWQGPEPRTFTYWSQLMAMLYGQLRERSSLRDLVFSLNQQSWIEAVLGDLTDPHSTNRMFSLPHYLSSGRLDCHSLFLHRPGSLCGDQL
jgi:hypothetical protein